jgi:hypothetical protein
VPISLSTNPPNIPFAKDAHLAKSTFNIAVLMRVIFTVVFRIVCSAQTLNTAISVNRAMKFLKTLNNVIFQKIKYKF